MKLYNTLSRKKEVFKPINENEILMYSCGPTVYNYFHIGNARPFIVFDTLRRYFEYRKYNVKFVQNFTDIDDKIIKRANEEKTTSKELSLKYIEEYFKDAKGLGIKDSIHPKATENIDCIIEFIKKLIEKGYAYNSDGDVYFRTNNFEGYGKLSHQNIDDLELGIRIDVNEKKEDPLDFTLWKASKPDEPYWESPWGNGRPGWHIECSAMANKFLGETIDIHSGGQDLIFPHHENEIAQSEAANGKPFANFWLHNGYINIDNRKMSKSLNNFFTVREISEKYGYEVIRFFMLSAHYRNPVNFSEELIIQSQHALDRIYNCLDNLKFLMKSSSEIAEENPDLSNFLKHKEKFIESMEDDINTADAIGCIFELVKEVNIKADKSTAKFCYELIKELGDILGLLSRETDITLEDKIENLIEERNKARAAKDFKTADKIRDELKAMGIILEDTKDGVKWRKGE